MTRYDKQLLAACTLSLMLALPLAVWLEKAWTERNAQVTEYKEMN